MSLKKYKLGELIEESFRKNVDLEYDVSYVRGISNNKEIMKTKADVDESVIHKFYIVNPGEFVYNPRTTRMGDKVGLGFNNTDSPLIFSFNNIAFYLKESAKSVILPEYLYIFFNRPEFDRYAMINGWGSATELFSIDEMYDVNIELPPIVIQQKYVDVYNALVENQKSYERGLDDLKLSCDAYIENLRRNTSSKEIGQYISCTDRVTDVTNLVIQGISNQHVLIDSNSRVNGVEKSKYLRINPFEFAYSPIHINDGSIAFNDKNESFLLSPIYKTFKVVKDKELNPEYLMMWLSRNEFTRYCWFYAFGSARDNFEWEQMCKVRIPIPKIEIQNDIVNIYKCYKQRLKINDYLKQQIKTICPILIKGSIEEGKKE